MRPRKPVLLYHIDPAEGGRLQFVFETRMPVNVHVTDDLTAVLQVALAADKQLLVLLWITSGHQADDRIQEITMVNPLHVRVLTVHPDKHSTDHAGVAERVAYANDMEGVTKAMKTLLERKRGPKRQLLPVVPVLNEAIEERATA